MRKKLVSRLNKTIGQLEGLKSRMVSEEYSCEELLNLLRAAQGSLRNLGREIMINEMANCVNSKMGEDDLNNKIKSYLDIAVKL